ncbi:type II toxin-antitoxin system PemK/MazF family toxin [Intrasporangium sp. DVR]|uniref:type II toxin-antitoxin system PemK/MazF family toxin n=1 Tax=Intrasporangium sp. DVR TaxID=3127867 RepID=UPI00313A68AE
MPNHLSTALDRITTALRGLTRPTLRRPARQAPDGTYRGDATTLPDTTYSPAVDGDPDPGEIVWAWVPFEEDHTRGKDRPVLVIGRDGDLLIGLQLTSRDHDRDEHQERMAGREWVDIGSGAWDGRGRPSEVRVNRLLRLETDQVRREGAVLPRERYDEVIAAARRHYS